MPGRHTIKAGFYINHSYKAQNLGAGGGASFQGTISFANDTANPLDTGFGFANAALGIFTSYQQQSKFVEGSFLYDQVDWYVQDNWKVNSKLTLDYGLRFVNQRPQYDQYLQSSNFFPERWSAAAAPTLYVPGCVNNANPCSGNNRQARNPLTGQLLGPNTSLAIGQIVPNTGDAMNGIVVAGDGIAKGNYEWPTIGYAPRFGVAYDLTGAQKFILRGGAGLFFDRPNGNSVFSQVGNPPFSTSTTVRYSQLQRPWQRRAVDAGASRDDRLQVRLGAAVVVPVERRHAVRAAMVVHGRHLVRGPAWLQPAAERRHQRGRLRRRRSRRPRRTRRSRPARPRGRRLSRSTFSGPIKGFGQIQSELGDRLPTPTIPSRRRSIDGSGTACPAG